MFIEFHASINILIQVGNFNPKIFEIFEMDVALLSS
jgi:hypothetical protein